jgi:elongation factor G
MRILKAQVPMSEMLDFEPTLTSITGGRGSFLMEFSHYEEAPGQLQQKRFVLVPQVKTQVILDSFSPG